MLVLDGASKDADVRRNDKIEGYHYHIAGEVCFKGQTEETEILVDR